MSSSQVTPVTAELGLGGMHCSSCVALIEETLAERAGVLEVSASLEPPRATVVFDPAGVTLDDLCSAIASLGYSAAPLAEGTSAS